MQKLIRANNSVKELTDMYADGDIAIAEIQRDFVWDAKRIAKLLDSLRKDYPSGAIILWRPEFRTRSEFENAHQARAAPPLQEAPSDLPALGWSTKAHCSMFSHLACQYSDGFFG